MDQAVAGSTKLALEPLADSGVARWLRTLMADCGGEHADALLCRQIVDKLPQCIFWKDATGNFAGCNLAGAQAVGLGSPAEIRGRSDFDFHDAAVAEYLWREDLATMRKGVPAYRIVSQGDGPPESARWYETSKVPLRDGAGTVVGLLICYEDVTVRQKSAAAPADSERLRQAAAELEERAREATVRADEQQRLLLLQSRYAAMGEMVGNIGHQWRQPLTTLGLLLQNIQYDARDGLIDAAELAAKLGQAQRLIERMSSTIDDFRGFFRPVADDVVFEVRDCLDEVLGLMQASLDHAQIDVSVNAVASCRICGRPNELGQVLMNLIANAKDALVANRQENRRISIELAVAAGGVTIREHNNGGEIPSAQLGRIFESYYTTKDEGTGVGLYITHKIVTERFGGTIACANRGGGVEFIITLPPAASVCG